MCIANAFNFQNINYYQLRKYEFLYAVTEYHTNFKI
jgi:hypothetical protein